jgi:hypothetical protein
LWAASVLAAHTTIESHDLVDQIEALGTVGDQEHRRSSAAASTSRTRVSFLMCPSCILLLLTRSATARQPTGQSCGRGLENVRVEGSWALIDGTLGEYSIHLGSAVEAASSCPSPTMTPRRPKSWRRSCSRDVHDPYKDFLSLEAALASLDCGA